MGPCESLPFSFCRGGAELDQGKWPAPCLVPMTEQDSRKVSGLRGEACECLAVLGCACLST